MKLLIRWIIAGLSLFVAAWLVPGIRIEGSTAWVALAVMALVLGFVNAFIRPFLAFLSCGFIIITMGLFMLVINALTFMLASYISTNWFGVGLYVDGFGAALLGSIIVSVVSFILSMILIDDRERRRSG